jgi:hypothetical protein
MKTYQGGGLQLPRPAEERRLLPCRARAERYGDRLDLRNDPETVRHYTKRKRAYMIARGAAERVKGGTCWF